MQKIGTAGVLDGFVERKNVCVERHGAFTQSYSNHLNSMAFVTQDGKVAVLRSARWDTGSELTYICPDAGIQLSPSPDVAQSAKGIDGIVRTGKSFKVAIELPGGIKLANVDIGELDLSMLKDCDAIIGMDIINMGSMSVNGRDRTFSFEI